MGNDERLVREADQAYAPQRKHAELNYQRFVNRYLAVDYRGGGVRRPVFDAHLSGEVLGVTFDLK